MNWLDIAILIVVAFFLIIGLTRGLLGQLFSLLAIAGGIGAGLIFYDQAGALFIEHNIVEDESIANIGGFLITAFLAYVVFQVLGWLVTGLTGTLKLGFLNRLAGGLIGIVIGAALVFFLISSLNLLIPEDEPPFSDSVLLPYLNSTFSVVKENLPRGFDESIKKSKEFIREERLKSGIKIKEFDQSKESPD